MSSAEHALYRLEHPGGLERFHHEILGTRLDRLDHEGLLTHRAAHQNLRIGILLADLAYRFNAAHIRHHDVHRDEVRLEFAIAVHRLTPGLRLTHYLESRLGKDVRDHGAHEDGIIADQHRMAHAILRLRAAFGLLKRLS